MSLIQIRHAVRRLSLGQLRKLDEWLHELISRVEESDQPEESSSRRQSVKRQSLANETYRQEGIICGKEKCKRTRGQPRGPYWIATPDEAVVVEEAPVEYINSVIGLVGGLLFLVFVTSKEVE
jgi:hypothetical protein